MSRSQTGGPRPSTHAQSLHDLARLGPVRERSVQAAFGHIGLTEFGPESAPPLLLMPGGNHPAPRVAAWFPQLARSHRVLVPDLPGMPGPSTAPPLPRGRRAQGQWCEQLLDVLGLPTARIVGVSFGAGLTLRMAGTCPHRIERAALVVPAGFGYGSWARLVREIVLPSLAHRVRPAPHRLARVAYGIAGTAVTDTLRSEIGEALTADRLETSLPGATTRAELRDLQAPVLVAATEDDLFFPARVVLPRARAVVPNLARVLSAPGRHWPPPESLRMIDTAISEFLTPGNEPSGAE